MTTWYTLHYAVNNAVVINAKLIPYAGEFAMSLYELFDAGNEMVEIQFNNQPDSVRKIQGLMREIMSVHMPSHFEARFSKHEGHGLTIAENLEHEGGLEGWYTMTRRMHRNTPIYSTWVEYKEILAFYGDTHSKRSIRPYMGHINDGLRILSHLKMPTTILKAWCLHPLVQNNHVGADWAAERNITQAYRYAVQYSKYVNQYLGFDTLPETLKDTPAPLFVHEMAVADKVSNYSDFIEDRYCFSNADRNRLTTYFNNWLSVLGLDYKTFKQLSPSHDLPTKDIVIGSQGL